MISKGLKKYRLFFLCLMMAPVFSTLTGCARPNDEDMVDMLSKAYQCKWIKVDSYEKTDSLPGIWSYIAQYDFKLRFREGEAGAYKFMKGMYNTVPGETDWQKVLQNPNARAYIRDNCSPPAQKIMEQIAIRSYIQLHDKKMSTVRIPVSVSLSGWAETSSGRGGWNMDMRRDKVKTDFEWTNPIPRKDLTAKIVAKPQKQ